MKTIEERAKEYVERHGDNVATHCFGLGRSYRIAYEAGAIEQKAIDDAQLLKLKSAWEKEAQINHNDVANYKQGYHDAICKACDWLKERVQCGVHPQRAYGFAEEFRKAMEE